MAGRRTHEEEAGQGTPGAVTPDPFAVSRWIDWRAAAGVAARVGSPGPEATPAERELLVADLRDAAQRAATPVVEACRLGDLLTAEQARGPASVLVVDRAGWARANAQSMSVMSSRTLPVPPSGVVPTAAQAVATGEVAALLAFLSRRVLGQFDPYGRPTAGTGGRLLLVAPNVLEVERSLDADPTDFRLWVCLHEMAHAFQFAAAPWLADHVLTRASELAGSLLPHGAQEDDDAPRGPHDDAARPGAGRRFLALLRGVVAAVFGRPGSSLVDAALTPVEREGLAEITAVMSLLEGHADVAMDAVGPEVVPSVATLRRAFERRRDAARGTARVVNRLLGMEAKTAQYRDGAVFVRGVVDVVGHDGLNAVWAGPQNLPSAVEIAEPARWVRRVHG